ncbi:Glutamate-ammonia-ligase adenylyltransferase [Planctomycetes bacterium CA13]|uniref:Glutamate-ammonia-ligase adenylyltransferase n=1 Tax=Novipirellula herctigrandis TaxID=2527986 RepID=A0A5C5YY67_9BACT|nr:Glutamate-ammonia-ligase adenylyltransferase [Planctomycetes bacterium CA13]
MEKASGWIESMGFDDQDAARSDAQSILQCGAPDDLLDALQTRLIEQLPWHDCPGEVFSRLRQFLLASENPTTLLSLFESDASALEAMLQILGVNESLSAQLIAEPEFFDWLRQSGGKAVDRGFLLSQLEAELQNVVDPVVAASMIDRFVNRETGRIVYGEFVRSMIPEKVGRQLAFVADAAVRCGLGFCLRYLSSKRGMPQLPSGEIPEVTVIALGNLGAEELSYGDTLELVFLYDRIDSLNQYHRQFYDDLVGEMISLLRADTLHHVVSPSGIEVDLRSSPKYEIGVRICSSFEAIRIYETSGRTWQRLNYIKARVIAGNKDLGDAFLKRLQPWVYRRYITRTDLAEIQTFRQKLERRTQSANNDQQAKTRDVANVATSVLQAPGGRQDIGRTIQFLQLLHGGDLESVRTGNVYDAIVALEQAGCVTQQEASLLSENHARLCRLQHLLTMMFATNGSRLPNEPENIERLAWRLGLRDVENHNGDAERFYKQLDEIFSVNRRMINHLMVEAPDDGSVVAIETELMLDPDPTPEMVTQTLSKHRLKHPRRAMEDLIALSTESVPFLSPHRCRHFFSLIAPALLTEISKTPMPGRTLASLVKVTDSLGAKATLWELMAANRPTMQLMVRLCAAAPYLVEVLTENPGMIDELIDSLSMDRLPSAERLDAQSIELTRGAEDLDPILHSFKHSAHLTIGVRNILGKETLAATQQAIGDTAEACLHRITQYEHNRLAAQFGDPVDADGQPVELIVVGLGKLGGREPNYHSDLDVIFLYSAEGETRRRVGGPRSTTSNRNFFNQVARRVIERIDTAGPMGRLYELEGRLKPTGEEGVLAESTDDFLSRFRQATAPLWQWLAICKARTISGTRKDRKKFDSAIMEVIQRAPWSRTMASEIRELRLRMQETAAPGNLKRGEGGTADVEFVSQMLTLRCASESPELVSSVVRPNTVQSLQALAKAGRLSEQDALQLIAGYQTLRGVELNLRLMNSTNRHELPQEEYLLQNLAFLMNESDSKMIVAACSQARQRIRKLFDAIFKRAMKS